MSDSCASLAQHQDLDAVVHTRTKPTHKRHCCEPAVLPGGHRHATIAGYLCRLSEPVTSGKDQRTTAVIKENSLTRPYNYFFRRSILKLFEASDENGDGVVDKAEAYEMVLHMYVKINRQAPITPPTKETVERLFETSDVNADGTLDKDEFATLCMGLVKSAAVRVAAFKFIQWIVAPLLAMYVASKLEPMGEDIRGVLIHVVPLKLQARLLSRNFGQMLLTILFISSLAPFVTHVMGTINRLRVLRRAPRGTNNRLQHRFSVMTRSKTTQARGKSPSARGKSPSPAGLKKSPGSHGTSAVLLNTSEEALFFRDYRHDKILCFKYVCIIPGIYYFGIHFCSHTTSDMKMIVMCCLLFDILWLLSKIYKELRMNILTKDL